MRIAVTGRQALKEVEFALNIIKLNVIRTQLKVFLRGYLREKMTELWRNPGSIYGVLYHFNLPEEHKLTKAYSVMIAQGCLNTCSSIRHDFTRGA